MVVRTYDVYEEKSASVKKLKGYWPKNVDIDFNCEHCNHEIRLTLDMDGNMRFKEMRLTCNCGDHHMVVRQNNYHKVDFDMRFSMSVTGDFLLKTKTITEGVLWEGSIFEEYFKFQTDADGHWKMEEKTYLEKEPENHRRYKRNYEKRSSVDKTSSSSEYEHDGGEEMDEDGEDVDVDHLDLDDFVSDMNNEVHVEIDYPAAAFYNDGMLSDEMESSSKSSSSDYTEESVEDFIPSVSGLKLHIRPVGQVAENKKVSTMSGARAGAGGSTSGSGAGGSGSGTG